MSSSHVNIGQTRQLFLDDHIVEEARDVVWQVHRPRRHLANPIVKADQPWEQNGGGVDLYGGTVFYDEEDEIFKLWYRVYGSPAKGSDGRWHEPPGSYMACYATSTDGINWEKPILGLRAFDGSTDNNLLLATEGGAEQLRRPNLIKDYSEPDAGQRYKMVYLNEIDGRWGLSKGFSADGIHWDTNVGERKVFEKSVAPNGLLFGWDEGNQEFVHFHRKGGEESRERVDVDGRFVRRKAAIVRSSSPDFIAWGDPVEVLSRSETDPPYWSPSHGMDLAGMQYTDDLYIGTVDTCTTFHVEDQSEDLSPEQWRVYSSMFAEYRTEFVFSRDNKDWKRLWPGWEFFPPAQWRAWDDKTIGVDRPIVHNGQILWFYCGNNLPLGVNIPDHPLYEIQDTVVNGEYLGFSIGLATMRLDGFVSMDGYEPAGTLVTKPLLFEGDRLLINARAPETAFDTATNPYRPFGKLTVEILGEKGQPLSGYTADDCDAFTGDETSHVVTWNGSPSVGTLAGQPVQLRFNLRNTALYALEFTSKSAPESPINRLSPGSRGRP